MADLGNFLQVALTVLTLAALASVGLMKGTITNLRESLADARGDIADGDRRHTETKAELVEAQNQIVKLRAQINSQAHDLEAVGRLVRGESYWLELGEKLDAHHAAAEEHWAEDERLLRKILKDLDDFMERVK